MTENQLLETLANYSHEAWSSWMRYMFSRGKINSDGSWTMPVNLVARWCRQMNTPYENLPEDEKISDLKEAKSIFNLVQDFNCSTIEIVKADYESEVERLNNTLQSHKVI